MSLKINAPIIYLIFPALSETTSACEINYPEGKRFEGLEE